MPKWGGSGLTAEGEFNSHTINPAPIWIIPHRISNTCLHASANRHNIISYQMITLLGAGVSAEHKKLDRPLSDGLICDRDCRDPHPSMVQAVAGTNKSQLRMRHKTSFLGEQPSFSSRFAGINTQSSRGYGCQITGVREWGRAFCTRWTVVELPRVGQDAV